MAYVSDNPNFTEKSENDVSRIEDSLGRCLPFILH